MRTFLSIFLFASILVSCNSTDHAGEPVKIASDPAQMKDSTVRALSVDLQYDIYCNARFKYCVPYPASILTPQPESANGDGRIFTDKEAKEVMRVWGRNNVGMVEGKETLSAQFISDLKDIETENKGKVTYQKLGDDFFIISGTEDGEIFYQKTLYKDGKFSYAVLRYSEADKETYDKMAAQIYTAFK